MVARGTLATGGGTLGRGAAAAAADSGFLCHPLPHGLGPQAAQSLGLSPRGRGREGLSGEGKSPRQAGLSQGAGWLARLHSLKTPGKAKEKWNCVLTLLTAQLGWQWLWEVPPPVQLMRMEQLGTLWVLRAGSKIQGSSGCASAPRLPGTHLPIVPRGPTALGPVARRGGRSQA